MDTVRVRRMVCPQPRRLLQGACLCLSLLLCNSVALGAYVELGPASSIAIDQPRVAVEVYIPDPEHSFGPSINNTWLLDTGAQALLAAGGATAEMVAQGYDNTAGTYDELGLGGSTTYDVSAVYDFDFAGNSGVRNTLEDVRILSHDTASFGGFGGIVGMVAMANRVSSLDLTPMSNTPFPDLISVEFSGSVPGGAGHRYAVDLDLQAFPASGDPPLPSYGPLPFLDVEFQHASTTLPVSLIFDTGGQFSLLSTQLGLDLGLDSDGNGNIDENDDAWSHWVPLGGIGGTELVPFFAVDKLLLPTIVGIDLIWTDVFIGIVDIDPSLSGIFGSDILTSGYFPNPDEGYIEQVHLDFTDSDNLNGLMYLDLNPNHDNVIPDSATLLGDANLDDIVDLQDFSILKANFGTTGGWTEGNFNDDNLIDLQDFSILKANFGNHLPEPTTLAVLACGALSLAGYRRRPV